MRSKLLAGTAVALFALAISPTVVQAQTDNRKQMDAAKKRIENVTQYNVVRPSTGTPTGYTGPYIYPPKKVSIDRINVPSTVNIRSSYTAPKSTTTYTAPTVQRSTTTTTVTPSKKP